MKSLKTIVYTFIVLIAFSCNTNEEIFEAENHLTIENIFEKKASQKDFSTNKNQKDMQSSRSEFLFSGSEGLEYETSTISIRYFTNTTDEEKRNIRETVGVQIGLVFWRSCPRNSDIELWTIPYVTQNDFNSSGGGNEAIQASDDISGVYYNRICF